VLQISSCWCYDVVNVCVGLQKCYGKLSRFRRMLRRQGNHCGLEEVCVGEEKSL